MNAEPKDDKYLSSRFSADREYALLLDEISMRPLYIADRYMRVSEKHKKLRASRIHIFRSAIPMRLSFITRKMWSKQDTRRRYFDAMKLKLPFLADDVEETLRRSPFETKYQLCLFINNYIPKTKNVVVFGYHKKKKQFSKVSELLMENNRLNYLKHYECRIEESFARRALNGEVREKVESLISTIGHLQESIALLETKEKILENLLELVSKELLPFEDMYPEMPIHMKIIYLISCAKARNEFFKEMLSNPDIDLTYFLSPGQRREDGTWSDSVLFVKRGDLIMNCLISDSNRIISLMMASSQKSVIDMGVVAEIVKEVCSMMMLNFGPRDARQLGFMCTILLSSGRCVNSDTLYDGVIVQFTDELYFPDLDSDEMDVVLTRENLLVTIGDVPFVKLDCRRYAHNKSYKVQLVDQKDKLLEKWLNQKSMKADELLSIVIDSQINYNRFPEKPGVKAMMYWLAMRLRNFLYLDSLALTVEEMNTVKVMSGEETSKSIGKVTVLERSIFAERAIKQKSSFNFHPLFRNLLNKEGIREAVSSFWRGERIENYSQEIKPILRLLRHATEDNGCQEEYRKSSLDFNPSRVLVPNLSQSDKKKFFGILNREKKDYKEKMGSLLDSNMNLLKKLRPGKENRVTNSIIMNTYLNLSFPNTDHRVELKELTSSDVSLLVKLFEDPDSILEFLDEGKKKNFEEREEDEEDIEGLDLDTLLDMLDEEETEKREPVKTAPKKDEEKESGEQEESARIASGVESGPIPLNIVKKMKKKEAVRYLHERDVERRAEFSKEEYEKMDPMKESRRLYNSTTSFRKDQEEEKSMYEREKEFKKSRFFVEEEEFRDSWETLTGDQIAVGELMLELPDVDVS